MAGIRIGSEECPITEIVKFCQRLPMNTVPMCSWSKLVTALELSDDFKNKFQRDWDRDRIKNHDIPSEIFTNWISEFSKNATIGKLLTIIMDNFAWTYFEDFLREKIQQNAKSLNDLDDKSKEEVLNCKIGFLGRIQTLAALKSQMKQDEFTYAIQNNMSMDLIWQALKGDMIKLDNVYIPDQLHYYINRTLVWKRKLNPAVFQEPCPDIFVLEGLKRNKLSILIPKNQHTEFSGKQLKRLSVRFILLELEDDFEKIVKQANVPVHRIKFKDHMYCWTFSVGSVRAIRPFLLEHEAEEISEHELVETQLAKFCSRPQAIVSSPGMGKSTLLGSIANRVQKQFPERNVIFLELSSLVDQLESSSSEIQNLSTIKDPIAKHLTGNRLGERLIRILLDGEEVNFEIFFDGFDEIPFNQIKSGKELLSCLLESNNIRAHFTSRPHLRSELEDTIGVVSLDIAPFQKPDQMKFLCDFWGKHPDVGNVKKLSDFASMAIKDISSDYIGIPLQCFLLANVYSEEVKRYLKLSDSNYQISNPSESLFGLYSQFVEMKFETVPSQVREQIRTYHWKEALKLLFPHDYWVRKVRNVLKDKIEESEIREEEIEPNENGAFFATVYKIGIPQAGRIDNCPLFLHRSLAEFFVGDMVVEYFKGKQLSSCEMMAPFILDTILEPCDDPQNLLIEGDCMKWIIKTIEASATWKNDSNSKNRLIMALLPELDIEQSFFGRLRTILSYWRFRRGYRARFGDLISQLNGPHWREIVNELKNKVFKFSRSKTFVCATVCFFLNANLASYKYNEMETGHCILYFKARQYFFKSSYMERIFVLIEKRFKHLLQVIAPLLFCKPLNPLNNSACQLLLRIAAVTGELDMFECCCQLIDEFGETTVSQVSFPQIKHKDIEFEVTPLHNALHSGGYKLCEHLIKCYENQLPQMYFLHEFMVQDSGTDSPGIVKDKMDLIKLLSDSNARLDVASFRQMFINCDIAPQLLIELSLATGYVPLQQDEESIHNAFQFNIKNDAEMNLYVDWLASGKQLSVITYDNAAIVRHTIFLNILKPGTLHKIYQLCPFDLSKILFVAVACKRADEFVKLIVNVSGNVNITDSDEKTMLNYAAVFRKPHIFSYLMSFGARLHLSDLRTIFSPNLPPDYVNGFLLDVCYELWDLSLELDEPHDSRYKYFQCDIGGLVYWRGAVYLLHILLSTFNLHQKCQP